MKEAQEEQERHRQYEEERGQRRVEIEVEVQQISDAKKKLADQRGAKRREDRIKSGRKLNPFQEQIQLKDDETTKFGIDYEIEKKRILQHDSALANNILDWIEDLTGEELDYFYECLKSGRILCKLMNTIRPNTIKKINPPGRGLAERENIQRFLNSCVSLGVGGSDIFDVNDLYSNSNPRSVMQCLLALSRLLSSSAWYSGPICKTSEVALRNMTMAGAKRNISVGRVLKALDTNKPEPDSYFELSKNPRVSAPKKNPSPNLRKLKNPSQNLRKLKNLSQNLRKVPKRNP